MAKYRKKPVVIDAYQFTKDMVEAYFFDDASLPDGISGICGSYHKLDRKVYDFRATIKTLKGNMLVEDGDWVITGVKGERYPCKPDIFAATYEPAGPDR